MHDDDTHFSRPELVDATKFPIVTNWIQVTTK